VSVRCVTRYDAPGMRHPRRAARRQNGATCSVALLAPPQSGPIRVVHRRRSIGTHIAFAGSHGSPESVSVWPMRPYLRPPPSKGRGICPSCGGRRMADPAANMVDRVFPEVPVRQWVLTFPFALRYRLAYDAKLAAAVDRAFIAAVLASLARRARGLGRGRFPSASTARSSDCWCVGGSGPRQIRRSPTRWPKRNRCWPGWPRPRSRDGPLRGHAPACGLAARGIRSTPRRCRDRLNDLRPSTASPSTPR
jgi:hypothetical protein